MSILKPAQLLSSILRPLPQPIALTRLKLNAFALFLVAFAQTLFTPYTTLRRGIIWFIDEQIQGRSGGQTSWAGGVFWAAESLVTAILLWNALEAWMAIRYPRVTTSAAPTGMQMTPSRMSSPLTRPYPTTFTPTPSKPSPFPSTSLQRPSTPQTSTPSRLNASTSHRSSPLSASTAKILNIHTPPPSLTGLFFDPDATASPSKIGGQGGGPQRQEQGQGQSQGQPSGATGTGASGGGSGSKLGPEGFVLVEREEKEWVDNLWKGVRGKGGRVGI